MKDKDNIIAFAGFGVLIAISVGLAGLIIVRPALAQVDATSSDPAVTSSSSTAPTSDVADTADEDIATTTPTDTPTTVFSSVTPTEPAPEGLALVHIIGT